MQMMTPKTQPLMLDRRRSKMLQQNFSSREERKLTDQEKILQECKMTLELLDAALKPGRKLREMDKNVIDSFIEDLAMIDEKIKTFDMHKNPQLADQADSISSNILNAIIEFNLSADLLDMEVRQKPKVIKLTRQGCSNSPPNRQKTILMP